MLRLVKKIISALLPTSVEKMGTGSKKICNVETGWKKERESNQVISKNDLIHDLKGIGVKTGDSIIVHSSLK